MVEFVDIGASSKRLIEAGIPETQAESIVKVIAETLNQASDRLVSRDYLDKRLQEQRSYMDGRFIEERSYMDKRFSQVERQLIRMKAETDMGLLNLDHKINVLFLMVGLGFTVLIIPMLKGFFAA